MGCASTKSSSSKSATPQQTRQCITKLEAIIGDVESLSTSFVKDNALENFSMLRPAFSNVEQFVKAAFAQFKNESPQSQSTATEPMKFPYEEYAKKLTDLQNAARTPLLEGFIIYQNSQNTMGSPLFQTLVSKLIPVQNFALKLKIPRLNNTDGNQTLKVEHQLEFLVKQLSMSQSYKQQQEQHSNQK